MTQAIDGLWNIAQSKSVGRLLGSVK